MVGGDARGGDRDLHLLRHAAGLGDLEAVSHLRLRTARVHEPQGLCDRPANNGGRERSAGRAAGRTEDLANPGHAGPSSLRTGVRAKKLGGAPKARLLYKRGAIDASVARHLYKTCG